jgi:hypothetical protein
MSTIVTPIDHHFTLESLARKGVDFAKFQQWCIDLAPRVINNHEPYDDVLERLDGATWAPGTEVELPTSFASPVWRRMRGILARVVKDCRE